MQPLRGIAFKVVSIVVFVAMATIIKATADKVPAGEAVFFRSFFATPVILAWLAVTGELRSGLKTAMPLGHVRRGVVGTTAMGLNFAALGLLPFPEATAIGYAAPILTVIFAAMFLGEQVRAFRLTAVALGMIGVMIVLSPRLSIGGDEMTLRETLGAVLALGAAVFAALAQVQVRRLVATAERTSAIVFWFSITASLLGLMTIPWGWAMPDPATFALLVLSGLLGGLGQILLTSSYRYADVGVIAPFEYTSMLMALAVGYFLFDEVPTLVMIGGSLIIIGSGVLIIWRERRLGIERKPTKSVGPP